MTTTSAKSAWLAPFLHPTPERLERWLEAQAAQGWQPTDLGDLSAIRLHLAKSKSAQLRYVVDPQQHPDDDYRATYEDAGWEYVGELTSLQIWRRAYLGERPEAFTDRASRAARDRRLAWVTGIVGALALLGMVIRVALGVAGIGASSEDWILEAGVLALIGAAPGRGHGGLASPPVAPRDVRVAAHNVAASGPAGRDRDIVSIMVEVTRAEVHAALAEPHRIAIVDALALGDLSPSELGERTGQASNLLAHHLGFLRPPAWCTGAAPMATPGAPI